MSVRRPGDLRSHNVSEQPEQRMASSRGPTQLTQPWIDAYDRMSAAEAKFKCETDPIFSELANQLYALRNPGGRNGSLR